MSGLAARGSSRVEMLQSADTYLRELVNHMTKVFISYSHDSDEHRESILALSNRLRESGIDCEIDQYDPAPEEGWPVWMLQKMQDANYVLLICTETYRKRFEQREEKGRGLGVTWEGMLMQNQLYRNASRSRKFIPIILNADDAAYIPDAVYQYSHYDFSKPLAFENLYRHLRGALGATKPPLGQPHFQRTINSDDLPTVEGELFGRKEELALLDEALDDSTIHIVQFVASGGTGKTKLIRQWLDDNRNKIEALIAWSFYSQGSGEDKQISATPFFMQALKSLGSDKSVSDFHTEEEKGEYIADLLREKRCLLVLDGLEPLQQVGRGMWGELKDRAIRKMLRCLVGDHSSLCIITTRLPVHELKGRRQVVQHDLQNLAPEDGVALLRSFGVSGRDVDMLAAVEEYGRHALALHLLGNALATYLDGDVRKCDTLTELIGDYDDVERHAFKVMQAYQHWLAGTPELKLLYLLGLFDHPVEQEVLEVLWEAKIPGLTEGIDKKAWLVAQRDLISGLKMMSGHEIPSVSPLIKGSTLQNDSASAGGSPPLQKGEQGGFEASNIFDCHPLIREYFGRQLKENQGEVWRQAHTVLYEYYKGVPGKYLPDTLEEMQPLFRAVAHGCKGGLQNDCEEIFWTRIKRKQKHYISFVLGARLDELSAISNFFEKPWTNISSELSIQKQAGVFNWAGETLLAIGRTEDACNCLENCITVSKYIHHPGEAALAMSGLATAKISLGLSDEALTIAKDSVLFSQNHGDDFYHMSFSVGLATILHLRGQLKLAKTELKKAEALQKKLTPEFPLLYGARGYAYNCVLLDSGKLNDVIQRSRKTLAWAKKEQSILGIGLDNLILGEVYLTKKSFDLALKALSTAKDKLLQSGNYFYYVFSLLTYSKLKAKCKTFNLALESLQEAYEIINFSCMRLHLTDYHLEMARLILAVEADPTQYPNRKQRTLPFADQEEPGILTLESHIAEAARLIQETGYHRRDAELTELQKALEKP